MKAVALLLFVYLFLMSYFRSGLIARDAESLEKYYVHALRII